MIDLTDKQDRLLRLIARHIYRTGTQPSYRDICKEFGWASPNAVKAHISALEKKGVVTRVGARAVSFDWRQYLRAKR